MRFTVGLLGRGRLALTGRRAVGKLDDVIQLMTRIAGEYWMSRSNLEKWWPDAVADRRVRTPGGGPLGRPGAGEPHNRAGGGGDASAAGLPLKGVAESGPGR